MSLRAKTVAGISWNVASQLGQQGIGLIFTFLLARLLTPDSFGLLGMVTVFTGFIAVFQDIGLGPSIVQDTEITEEQLSAIFWLNILVSSGIALVVAACAPLAARFYDEPLISPIMMVLSLSFPLAALAMVPSAILIKNMAFRKLALVRNLSLFAAGIIGISFALTGVGVWALVARQIANTLFSVLVLWLSVRWRPTWSFGYRLIKKQFHFGLTLQGGSLLNYVTRNADDLLVGRFVGAEPLGIYQMAYRMMVWPLEQVSSVIGQVMFPALSSIQGDRMRVKRGFLRATSAVALITFPLVLGLWVVSDSAVHVVLGEQWLAVIPIFQVLCLLGLTQSIATNTGWIFLSQGRVDVRLKLSVPLSVVLMLSFVIGVRWGAMGVAVCYAITSLALTPVQLGIAGRLIDMTLGDILRAVAGVFVCAAVMACLVWALSKLLPTGWSHSAYLAIQVPFGVLVYWGLIHLFKVHAYQDVRALLGEQWQLRYRQMSVDSKGRNTRHQHDAPGGEIQSD